MTTTGYVFTVKDAASACQVSPRTITRRLPALQDHGATKDDAGVWHIPLGALLAVGLKPGKPAAPDPVTDMSYDSGAVSQDTVTPVVTPDVLAELADLRHRAELAEALLESERRLTNALNLALRALTPGTSGNEIIGENGVVLQDSLLPLQRAGSPEVAREHVVDLTEEITATTAKRPWWRSWKASRHR